MIAAVESYNTGIVFSTTSFVNAIVWLAFKAAAGVLRSGYAVNKVPGPHGDVEVLRKPLGVAVAIVPWNSPAALAAHKVANALAAGCPVILEPTEWAPYSCLFLADGLEAAGLPKGLFQIINGGGDVGGKLVGDKRVRAVSFSHRRRSRLPLHPSRNRIVKLPQLIALAAALAGAVPIRAQMVVRPGPKLDSTPAVVSGALYLLRDSLQYVEAASAQLARDRDLSSDAVLRSRARTMAERCESVVRIPAEVEAVVVRSARPNPDPKGDRPRYVGALQTLRRRMQDCSREFTRLTKPEAAQELRDYGMGKGQRVQEAIRAYDPEIDRYCYISTGRRYEALSGRCRRNADPPLSYNRGEPCGYTSPHGVEREASD